MPKTVAKEIEYRCLTTVSFTMCCMALSAVFFFFMVRMAFSSELPGTFPAAGEYCLSCHNGIAPSRPHDSKMMQSIYGMGANVGDPNGCVVCHGGNPSETTDANLAHSGAPTGNIQDFFTPVPGAFGVNQNSCGLCHGDHVYNTKRSLMANDAGKIKTITYSFGIDTKNKDHNYGNYTIDDPDGFTPRFGTERYKEYMLEMAKLFPGQYPSDLKEIPQVDLATLAGMPEQAAYAYLRNCNACHTNGSGKKSRGNYRGMGCAACHSLYGTEGYYEGGDPSIPKDEKGHILVHSMQASENSPIFINGKKTSGIQTATCAACHAAGRRIGHSYQGFMPRGSSVGKGPFDREGQPQKTNGGYVFNFVRDDAHHRVAQNGKMLTGLLCQDCHTTNSMHGNGNIGSTSLATIEVECADCHGTPRSYPWELPLGYGDEFGRKIGSEPRGVTDSLDSTTQAFGTIYPKEDGYLLSTRGNAYGNVVRQGDGVWVHTSQGLKVQVPVLKNIHKAEAWQKPKKAKVAMVQVSQHLDALECYACHSTWVPQYYGYKYVLDFRKDSIDWVASASKKNPNGTSVDYNGNYVMQRGARTEGDYSYVQWTDFVLGINGEGRVSPLTGVIQTTFSVIDTNGEMVAFNRIGKTEAGINSMELQPVQPHTISLQTRECASCHENQQAVGYGQNGESYDQNPSIPRYADAVDVDGNPISRFTEIQIQEIQELYTGFMQIFDKDGKQVMTVDSHWELSSPLTPEQREKLSRNNTCIACHQNIPEGSIPIAMLTKLASVLDLSYTDGKAHDALLDENNVLVAWIKFIGIICLVLLPFVAIGVYIYRRKKSRRRNHR